MTQATWKNRIANPLWVAILVFLSLPFVVYAFQSGLAYGAVHDGRTSRLFHAGAPLSNAAIFGHMLAGAVITMLAPLQLLSGVRQKWPALHRASGYGVALIASVTAVAGLFYIAVHGTIGGDVMNAGFALYGVLMLLCVFQTVRLARQRAPEHRLWAERLVILALASWLYRVHYGMWDIATGGLGSRDDFSGPFDIVQVFAFYIPYLLIHSWLWSRRRV